MCCVFVLNGFACLLIVLFVCLFFLFVFFDSFVHVSSGFCVEWVLVCFVRACLGWVMCMSKIVWVCCVLVLNSCVSVVLYCS